MEKSPAPPAWPEGLHRVLVEHGVRQVGYVPDAGHTRLIQLCHADKSMRAVSLTTEEEGVALAAGAHLGGHRAVLLMQSSGVGNCINMLGMIAECRFPLLALVTMRGQWGEFNPWQVPMGQGTPRALESVGVIVQHVDSPDEVVPTAAAAAKLAFNASQSVAVLIGQRVAGAKNWSK